MAPGIREDFLLAARSVEQSQALRAINHSQPLSQRTDHQCADAIVEFEARQLAAGVGVPDPHAI